MSIIDKIIEAASDIIARHVNAKKDTTDVAAKHPSTIRPLRRYGNAGRVEIPELNIGVALYDTRTGAAQQIVDNPESAVFLHWEEQKAIADHNNQSNFANLNRVRPYGTAMYLISVNGMREKYICVSSQIGHIKINEHGANTIYDSKWESPRHKNRGGVCVYTCIQRSAPDIMDIRLTYWRKAKNLNDR